MNRYRSYGELDDQPKTVGDGSFIGVDEYNAPENIQPGNVQKAVNHDFTSQDGNTRGGFVCLPELGANPLGLFWIDRSTPTAATVNRWRAVAYGAGVFVAVSDSGTGNRAMTSADGVTWTARTTPADNQYVAIAFGAGVFSVLTGNGGRGMYSSDGITWTQSAISSQGSFNGMTFGDGKFVAVGASGTAAYSVDGINWTSTTSGSTNDWGAVTYGNGKFVAVSQNTGTGGKKAIVSTDGISWTQYTTYHPSQLGIAYGNGLFVSCGISVSFPKGGVQYSSDGQTWLPAPVPDQIYTEITFGNGLFIAVSVTGTCIKSFDGIHWSTITISSRAWQGITYGASTFVAVGGSSFGVVATANDDLVYASGIYSDPNAANEVWIALAMENKVVFCAQGRTSKTIEYGVGLSMTEPGTIVQANNYVYIFRGPDETPLYWDWNWNGTFAEVPDTTLPDSFESIPNSNQATYYQNRLWVVKGKDGLAASDVLAFTDYDPLANEFNLNTGNSDYIVATYPFGQNSLVAFKNKSILLLQNVEGSLSDVTVTEVTRQVGVVGINSVTSIGPDLAYVSNRNINLLTLTATNNALQHKILPLSTRIRKIMDRVNWEQGYKISLGYWNNKLYVALPLDNSLVCNAVVVYNFTTEQWYGEWAFSDTLNMCIQGWQVVDYLGLQRMHAITEDGRIFVTDEGQNDISGTTVAEISTQLVTRAYDTDNLNHFQRRLYLDVATNRPEFSVSSFTEGANEESVLLTDQTYSRSETWKFADSAYDLTNANNDYNRAYRKDYSTGPDSVQPGTGFEPEMTQELRLPLMTRRQGRLSWIEVTNTQGFISVMSLGYETRPGQRANLVQV